mmetsp:Transcript_3242/g.8835  ORF Transcript_3242/g.8835 Transcript_3242/m.8835 type:complete len:238 (-) Transcript_3242:94-807(-)
MWKAWRRREEQAALLAPRRHAGRTGTAPAAGARRHEASAWAPQALPGRPRRRRRTGRGARGLRSGPPRRRHRARQAPSSGSLTQTKQAAGPRGTCSARRGLRALRAAPPERRRWPPGASAAVEGASAWPACPAEALLRRRAPPRRGPAAAPRRAPPRSTGRHPRHQRHLPAGLPPRSRRMPRPRAATRSQQLPRVVNPRSTPLASAAPSGTPAPSAVQEVQRWACALARAERTAEPP